MNVRLRSHSSTQQSHLGTGAYAIDEQPVAHDIHDVPHQENPHGQTRVLNAIKELLEGIEHHLRQQTEGEHQQVRTHERDEMLGQSHMIHTQIEDDHEGHQQSCHQGIGHKAVLQLSPNEMEMALTK